MRVMMDRNNRWWTAKRKTTLAAGMIRGKTTVAEARRSFDLTLPKSRDGWKMPGVG